jgi:hypothetical protein
MPETPPDPKNEMETFVEGLEPSPMKKRPSSDLPPVAPKPARKPPSNDVQLVALIVLFALLGAGGYYLYETYVEKPKVEEAVLPKPVEKAPAPPEPPVPAVPEPKPEQNQTIIRPARKPAKSTAEPEQPQRVETPAPVAAKAPPKPKVEQPAAPNSGILLWSGKAEKDGEIVIDGAKSDSGTVHGAALPGVPVTVRVEPKGFFVSDPPSAANGWKRIGIHSLKKSHVVVTVFWNTKPR